MRPRWAAAAAIGVGLLGVGAAAGEALKAGDICYRFCEDMSEDFVNRRADCPNDAPCGSPLPPGTASFDSCGSYAHVCGGAQQAAGAAHDLASLMQEAKAEQPRPRLRKAAAEGEVLESRRLEETTGPPNPCVVDPQRMECCELEENQPCLMKSIIKLRDGCSVACQKRYQSLPYQCFADFEYHFRFAQMMTNCDPTGLFKWSPPESTLAPEAETVTGPPPDRVGVVGDARRRCPLSRSGLAAAGAAAAAAILGGPWA